MPTSSLELDRYRISVSIHSLHWRIGEYDISVCVSPPILSVIIISSNLTRRVKQADGLNWQIVRTKCISNRVSSCRREQRRRDTANIKRHPTAHTLRGGPTNKPGKCLLVSRACKLKATDRELKSDTHWLRGRGADGTTCETSSRPWH